MLSGPIVHGLHEISYEHAPTHWHTAYLLSYFQASPQVLICLTKPCICTLYTTFLEETFFKVLLYSILLPVSAE